MNDDDIIKTRCHLLHSLLADPQPGITTWHEARARVAKELYAALGRVLGKEGDR